MTPSKRVLELEESPTLAISAKARALREEGRDIIGFGAGEPDFDTPDNIKEAAIRAINDGETKYTAVGGINELKDAIIDKFENDNQALYSRDEILVSCGGKHSFYNLCQALLDPDDEIIVAAPFWVSYPSMIELAGGAPIIVHTDDQNSFKMTADQFEVNITPRTKAVVINSPSNPTGATYTECELRDLVGVALANDLLIISDEIYEKLIYDSFNYKSVASLSEEVKAKSIILNGVSKTYAMTGWRIGYAAGPPELIKAMAKIQSQSTSNPTSISQWAAFEALNGPQDAVTKMLVQFEKRRDAMVYQLNSINDVQCLKPQGAFYAFPNISKFFGRGTLEKTINGSVDLADYLLEKAGVAVVPGAAFGNDSHIRLSFACSMEQINEGIIRMAEALSKLR
ncbi:MAG: pyridoxal phosphate-dependent aminotransferase [Thermodesulfobacteriota bacterium]